MRLGRAILTFALSVLWLGMPVHCQLEAVSTASLFACAEDTDCASPKDSGCEDDFCDSVESGNYFHLKWVVLGKAPIVPAAVLPEPARPVVASVALPVLPDAIPLLHSAWQFTYRTTGAPRAPSLTA